MMTDLEAYNIVHDALYETNSCPLNTWFTIIVNDVPMFEAGINNKGFIHVRKPKRRIKDEENRFLYDEWRFNKKKELVYDGEYTGVKPEENDCKTVIVNITETV